VGGWWPTKAPFRRAAQWDGVIPLKQSGDNLLTPQDVAEVADFIGKERTSNEPFDIAIINWTDPSDPQAAAAKLLLMLKPEQPGGWRACICNRIRWKDCANVSVWGRRRGNNRRRELIIVLPIGCRFA